MRGAMLNKCLASAWSRRGSALLLGFAVMGCRRSDTPVAAPSLAAATVSVTAPDAAVPLAAAAPVAWRVGTTGDYAPFSSRDASGKLQGFDIELASELASDSNA